MIDNGAYLVSHLGNSYHYDENSRSDKQHLG